MKEILKYIAPYQLYLTIKNTNKQTWENVLWSLFIIIWPVLMVFIFFNGLLLVASFIGWKWPDSFYIPFNGSNLQGHFDRSLLVVGVLMCVFKE
jgi:hypothetical protein